MALRLLLGFVLLMGSWPIEIYSQTCSYDVSLTSCDVTVTCLNRIEFNYDEIRNVYDIETCSNNMIYNGLYRRQVPLLNFVLKTNDFSVNDLIRREYSLMESTVFLNLSQNDLLYNPTCFSSYFRILKKIDFSHNLLREAKLFNNREILKLEELDYTFNSIGEIIIDENEAVYRNLRKLNLSSNIISNIKNANFDPFPKIETLDLSHNDIQQLSSLSFEGLAALQELYLSHNRIVTLDYLLFRFENLEIFEVSYNAITDINKNDFIHLNKLLKLDLKYNNIANIHNEAFYHLNSLKEMYLRGNTIRNISSDIFNNVTDLKIVDLCSNKLKSLPNQLFSNKKVRILYLNNNELEGSLVRGMFDGLEQVPDLDLSHQRISGIDDYSFIGMEKLTNLSLNNNIIGSISKNAFNNLKSLKRLDLSYNEIRIVSFETNDFINLVHLSLNNNHIKSIETNLNGLNVLRFLDLSNNNISKLTSNSFQSLSNLVSFDLFNNPVEGNLEMDTFHGLSSIPTLDLSGTMLTKISNNSFNGMIVLSALNLSNSNLEVIEFNAFSNTGDIVTLDLSHNKLKDLNINISGLSRLEVLVLNNNYLETISPQIVGQMTLLRELKLSHNNITNINLATFYNLNRLELLDISYNENYKLDLTFLYNTTSLNNLILSGINYNFTFPNINVVPAKKVFMADSNIKNLSNLHLECLKEADDIVLSHNLIESIKIKDFSEIKHLNRLDLSYNRLSFIQPGSFKENEAINVLNISHNLLTSINYGIFNGLSRLYILDISFNIIKDIKEERFREVTNLRQLIADNNKISYLDSKEFQDTNLEILSIGGNPLDCEAIVEFAKQDKILITTQNKDYHNYENINGVTCNLHQSLSSIITGRDDLAASDLKSVLNDIREVMLNITYKNFEPKQINSEQNLTQLYERIDKFYADTNQKSSRLNNLTEFLLSGNKQTNIILEKSILSGRDDLAASDLKSVLNNIREVMLNITYKHFEPKQINFEQNFQQLYQRIDKINADTNNLTQQTNTLLEKIVSTLKLKTPTPIDIPSTTTKTIHNNLNANNDNISVMINKLRDELKEAIAVERKSILSEIIKPVVATDKNPFSVVTEPVTDKLEMRKDSESKSLFTETCVGLILLLLVGMVLRKFYNSRMFVRSRRSASTGQIANSMESNQL